MSPARAAKPVLLIASTMALMLGFACVEGTTAASGAEHAWGAASTRAQTRALGRLDNRIKKVAARAKARKKVASLLNRRQSEVTRFVNENMTLVIDGAKASDWFRALDCVDVNLMQARLRAQKALKRGNASALLGRARTCVQGLQRSLGSASPAVSDLTALDTAIAAAQQTVTVAAIVALEKRKLGIADAHMTAPIGGVAASQWLRQLDCVAVALAQAKLRDSGKLKKGKVTSMLAGARKCAKNLSAAIAKGGGGSSPGGTGAPITFGSNNLAATPQSLIGKFTEDAEYWPTALGAEPAAAGYVASPSSPVDGMVTQVKLRGFAVSGDATAPGGAQPVRITVARPQSNGQYQVITTTDPPFTLPGSDGTHTFSMSAVRFACCRVKKGDVVALAARTGEHAVFAPIAGANTNSYSPPTALPSQNPGFLWTGTSHPNVELLMQVTVQPQ